MARRSAVLLFLLSMALGGCTTDDDPSTDDVGASEPGTPDTLPDECAWMTPAEVSSLLGLSVDGVVPAVSDVSCAWILDTPDGSGTVPGRTGNAQVEVAVGPGAVELGAGVDANCEPIPLVPQGIDGCWDGRAAIGRRDDGLVAFARVEGFPAELTMPLARQLVVAALVRAPR